MCQHKRDTTKITKPQCYRRVKTTIGATNQKYKGNKKSIGSKFVYKFLLIMAAIHPNALVVGRAESSFSL
jgi:hypothetical protein